MAAEILNDTLPGGVEDPLNLISIKTGLHRRLHTKLYYSIANALVIGAYGLSDNEEEQTRNVVIALTVLRVIVFSLNERAPF